MSSHDKEAPAVRRKWNAYGHLIVQTGEGRDARYIVAGTLEAWPSLALAKRYAKKLEGHMLE